MVAGQIEPAPNAAVCSPNFVRRGASYIQNDHKQLLSDKTKARLSKEALVLAAAL